MIAVTLADGLYGLMIAIVAIVPSYLAYRKSQQIGDVPEEAGVEGGWDALVDRLLLANEEGRKKIEALEAKIDKRDDDIKRLEAEVRELKDEVRKLAALVNGAQAR